MAQIDVCIREHMHKQKRSMQKGYVMISNSGDYGIYFFCYCHNKIHDLRVLVKF